MILPTDNVNGNGVRKNNALRRVRAFVQIPILSVFCKILTFYEKRMTFLEKTKMFTFGKK